MVSKERVRKTLPFEAQLANVENFQVGDETLRTIDVSPKRQVGLTVVFIPGWNAELEDYEIPIGSLFENGRRVLALKTKGTEEEKARQLVEFIKQKGLEKVDIIAHSIGAMSALPAAAEISERVKHLILINPPSEENDPNGLIGKYSAMLKFEKTNTKIGVGGIEIRRMSRVISSFQMKDFWQQLVKKGVKVASIHGYQDILFPPPESAVEINGEDIPKGHDKFRVEGNHLTIDTFIPLSLKLLAG